MMGPSLISPSRRHGPPHPSRSLWEEADRFRPERFSRERREAVGRFAYLPFGAGQHVCVGQHLGLPAMVALVTEFARRFDLAFPHADGAFTGLATLKPSKPLRAVVSPRNPP